MRRTFAGPSIRRERLAKSEVMCIFQLPFRNSYSLNGAGSTAGLLFAMCLRCPGLDWNSSTDLIGEELQTVQLEF